MQYVQGYYRGKDENKTKVDGNVLIATVIFVATGLLIAAVFWQITIGLIVTGALGYLAHKQYQRRLWLRDNGLLVNYVDRTEYI